MFSDLGTEREDRYSDEDAEYYAKLGEPVECVLCGSSLCAHGLCSNTGDPWTSGCANSYAKDGYQCQNCAETAHEEWLSEYYGGNGPQTDREREEVARQR